MAGKPRLCRLHDFRGEQVIPLKRVMSLPLFLKRPTFRQVGWWWKYGIDGICLETRKEGRHRYTSIEAVQRFLERTQ